MAFLAAGWQMKEASGVAGSTGQYLFQKAEYITQDAPAAVEAANYLPAAQNSGSDPITNLISYLNFPAGLVITVLASVNTAPVLKMYVVTASSSAGVTLALIKTTAG